MDQVMYFITTVVRDWQVIMLIGGVIAGYYKIKGQVDDYLREDAEWKEHNSKEHQSIVTGLHAHVDVQNQHDRKMAEDLAIIKDRLERK